MQRHGGQRLHRDQRHADLQPDGPARRSSSRSWRHHGIGHENFSVNLNSRSMPARHRDRPGTILNDDLPACRSSPAPCPKVTRHQLVTFVVRLMATGRPRWRHFDISTANATATAGSDYVANALTGQASAMRQLYTSSSSDRRTVNEPDETFFVMSATSRAIVATPRPGHDPQRRRDGGHCSGQLRMQRPRVPTARR